MVSSSADSKRPSPRATQSDAAGKAAASDPVNAGRTTIRLPFMTASFTRPPRSASVAAAAWTPQASIRQAADSLHVPIPRSRWALYGAPSLWGRWRSWSGRWRCWWWPVPISPIAPPPPTTPPTRPPGQPRIWWFLLPLSSTPAVRRDADVDAPAVLGGFVRCSGSGRRAGSGPGGVLGAHLAGGDSGRRGRYVAGRPGCGGVGGGSSRGRGAFGHGGGGR